MHACSLPFSGQPACCACSQGLNHAMNDHLSAVLQVTPASSKDSSPTPPASQPAPMGTNRSRPGGAPRAAPPGFEGPARQVEFMLHIFALISWRNGKYHRACLSMFINVATLLPCANACLLPHSGQPACYDCSQGLAIMHRMITLLRCCRRRPQQQLPRSSHQPLSPRQQAPARAGLAEPLAVLRRASSATHSR